ncbi:MAG: T9SS type A sorting domain-containing protein [Ignavibacteriales bacterium]|nr:T9SS type A sorting domain-containing protein [Ignavibacteriales bacterium]
MKMLNRLAIILLVTLVSFSQIQAQPFTGKVLYLTTDAQLAGTDDAYIVAKLTSWGLTVDIKSIAGFKTTSAPVPTNDELKQYKFAFVSEYCGSGDGARFRGATGTTWTGGWLNIPVISTDNWFAKVGTFGFVVSSSNSATTYGNVCLNGFTPSAGNINGSGKVKIVDQSNHILAGGLSSGAEIDLATATTEATGAIINFSVPTITPIIPIATVTEDATSTQLVAYGVEKGTATFKSTGGTIDPTLKTSARIAIIGIAGQALGTVTNDGFKLILGAVKWVMDPTSDVEKTDELPTEYTLEQNYPNPFNPSTKITFSLPKDGMTSLSVYNLLGEKVASLVNEELQAGAHSYSFDASRLSSGIYFYKLDSDQVSLTKKMILIK